MSHTSTSTTLLFPGALGDFLCLWPSLQTLAEEEGARGEGRGARQKIRVFAKPAWQDLLDEERFERLSVDRREIADLFGTGALKDETRALLAGEMARTGQTPVPPDSSPPLVHGGSGLCRVRRVHSWTGHGDARFAERLAAASGAEVFVHPFRGMADGEHASAYFARCLGVRATTRLLPAAPEAERWADEFWSRNALGDSTLAIHPGSGSAKKNWQGMREVARLWREERGGGVLLVTGPAEEDSALHVPSDAVVRNERLDRVAALLHRAHLYLGNDSGVSHLAGLSGCLGVVLFGPSDPRTWHPLGGGLRVLHAPEPCGACGAERFCVHRATVEMVSAALAAISPRTCTPRRAP